MNKHFFTKIIFSFLIGSMSCLCSIGLYAQEMDTESVRSSVIAGTWYPGDPIVLSKSIQNFLSQAKVSQPDGPLKGIIVPHAGYVYSGSVAAHAYKLLKNSTYNRIILIGPSHRMAFRGVSVNLQGGYETPLGIVPVDRGLAKRILNSDPCINWIKQAHSLEHSLEIQLPFLQTVLSTFEMVPILMGEQDFGTCLKLADALVPLIAGDNNTLLVASSDLSHYHTYNDAKVLDSLFIRHVKSFNPEKLAKDLSAGKCEACGGGPVITTLLAVRKLGAKQSIILKYANSGDVTGDHSRVVGYLAAALIDRD
jgi:AmmeMemoRadiSam system protein B